MYAACYSSCQPIFVLARVATEPTPLLSDNQLPHQPPAALMGDGRIGLYETGFGTSQWYCREESRPLDYV